MNYRNPPAPAILSDLVSLPGDRSSLPLLPVVDRPVNNQPLKWPDIWNAASPIQREALLNLARTQGVVFGHQLPASPGTAKTIQRLIASVQERGKEALEPLRPAAFQPLDESLDECQRDAAAKALATPDICLIQGLPGTGKSRLAAEITAQALRRGERVLLAAGVPEAADAVLTRLASREGIYAVRCVGPAERVDELPGEIRALTLAERARFFEQETLTASRQEVETAESLCRQLGQDLDRLGASQQLTVRWQELEAELTALRRARTELPAAVERDARAGGRSGSALAAALAVAWEECRKTVTDCESKSDSLRGDLAERQRELDQWTLELNAAKELVEAKKAGRWWTTAWWKALFAGDVQARFAELQARHDASASRSAEVHEEIARLRINRELAENAAQQECARLIVGEVASRQANLDNREAACCHEQAALVARWEEAVVQLSANTSRPSAMAPEACQVSSDLCRQALSKNEQDLAFLRQWAQSLAEMIPTLPVQLASHANLVAGSFAGLTGNSLASDAPLAAIPFDLLLVEDAHLLADDDFQVLAARARRWVLLGDPPLHEPALAHSADGRKHDSGRSVWSPAITPPLYPARPLFHTLWQQLHCDPRTLPYFWFRENGRFGCRLRPVAPDQRKHLESERVADSPEIELRILSLPRTPPALTELLFPPAMPIGDAKEYIFRELQELAVRGLGSSYCWSEEAGHIILRISDTSSADAITVQLGNGIQELVGIHGPDSNGESQPAAREHTCSLEFDRSAGWNRSSAEDWVQRHLGIRDSGRTAVLNVPHRPQPELAGFISDVLFPHAYRMARRHGGASAGKATNGCSPAVEFVPIAPAVNGTPAKETNGRRGGRDHRAPAQPSSSLELDLSDTRQRDRLAADLRDTLPRSGIVNLAEAYAVIKTLTELPSQPAFRSVLDRARAGTQASVAVIAPRAAQAELIRQLVQRSTALQTAELNISIGVPGAFHAREYLAVLVSLTRSHAERAVSFFEHPRHMALSLTRPCARLTLFGDPETLARRSQWHGPVDHQDESTAAGERELVARLLRWFAGPKAHHHSPSPHEGNRR